MSDSMGIAARMRTLGGGRYGIRTKSARTDPSGIDRGRMTVPCTITTQDEDRSGDIVITGGIDLSDHRALPVVLVEHGLEAGLTFPIGKAEDDERRYTVEPGVGLLRAVTWFSQRSLVAEQVFDLVAEEILRGASIGFVPEVQEERAGGGMLVKRCRLFEYTHCAVPDNPYALADRIGGGRLVGRPIDEALLKSLRAQLPPLKEQVRGGWEGEAMRKAGERDEDKHPRATDGKFGGGGGGGVDAGNGDVGSGGGAAGAERITSLASEGNLSQDDLDGAAQEAADAGMRLVWREDGEGDGLAEAIPEEDAQAEFGDATITVDPVTGGPAMLSAVEHGERVREAMGLSAEAEPLLTMRYLAELDPASASIEDDIDRAQEAMDADTPGYVVAIRDDGSGYEARPLPESGDDDDDAPGDDGDNDAGRKHRRGGKGMSGNADKKAAGAKPDEAERKTTPTGMGETVGADGAYVPMDDEEATKAIDDADTGADMLPGQKALQGCHGLLSGLGEHVAGCYSTQENEHVTAVLDELSEAIETALSLVEEAHGTHYPDADALGGARRRSEDGEEGGEEEGDEEGKKDDDLAPGFKSRRLTEKGRKLAVAVTKAIRSREIGVAKRAAAVVVKRLGKHASACCVKAADFLDEMSSHEGELKSSHRGGAAHHSGVLRSLAAQPDEGGEAELKSMREKVARLEKDVADRDAGLALVRKKHEALVREWNRAKSGR